MEDQLIPLLSDYLKIAATVTGVATGIAFIAIRYIKITIELFASELERELADKFRTEFTSREYVAGIHSECVLRFQAIDKELQAIHAEISYHHPRGGGR